MNNEMLELKESLNKALTFEINTFYLLLSYRDNLELYMNNEKDMNDATKSYKQLEEKVLRSISNDEEYANSYSTYLSSKMDVNDTRKFILEVLEISYSFIRDMNRKDILKFHIMKQNDIKTHFQYLDLYNSFKNENESI